MRTISFTCVIITLILLLNAGDVFSDGTGSYQIPGQEQKVKLRIKNWMNFYVENEPYKFIDRLEYLLEHNQLSDEEFEGFKNYDYLKCALENDSGQHKVFLSQNELAFYIKDNKSVIKEKLSMCTSSKALVGVRIAGFKAFGNPQHELITQDALLNSSFCRNNNCRLYLKSNYCKTNKCKLFESPLFRNYIRGSFWSDDPEICFFKNTSSKNDKYNSIFSATGPAEFGTKFEVAKLKSLFEAEMNTLTERSHFGDLQFFHSMGVHGSKPEIIRSKILLWSEFLYKISIGEIDEIIWRDNEIEFIGKIKNMLRSDETRTLQALFAGKNKKVDIKEVALGSLLHLVEDSFTPSHTERNDKGQVVSFLSYSDQKGKMHEKGDMLTTSLTKKQYDSVVRKCADIINAHMDANRYNRKNWFIVEKKLQEIFQLSVNPKDSYGGINYQKE